MVECLPSMHKVLGLIPSTTKKKNTELEIFRHKGYYSRLKLKKSRVPEMMKLSINMRNNLKITMYKYLFIIY